MRRVAVGNQNEASVDPGAADEVKEALLVSIPLPDPLLTINVRRTLHWRVNGRHNKAQREMAALAAYEALSKVQGTLRAVYFPEGRVTVDVVVFRRPRQKQTDATGLIEALKPLMDGLEDSGVVSNDKQCQIGTVEWRPTDPQPRIELTLRQEAA